MAYLSKQQFKRNIDLYLQVKVAKRQGPVEAATTSDHSENVTDLQGFQGEFAWQGTSDISSWLAVPTALQLQSGLGVHRLRDHNHRKLEDAVQLLLKAWGEELCVLGICPATASPSTFNFSNASR